MCRRIAILGYYGHENIGDEAILEGLKLSIEQISKNIEITVISDNPDIVVREHNIRAVKKVQTFYLALPSPKKFFKELLAIMALLKKSKTLIIGGGGLFHDHFGIKPYGFIEIILAKIVDKPIILYSVGVGPYNTKLGKLFAGVFLNQVNLIMVRDDISKQWIKKIGVTKPSTIVTVDPVLILPPPTDEDIFDLGEKNCPWFGISVRPWFRNSEYKNILAQISDYIISKYEAEVIFIPMHFGRDDKTSHEIINMMQNENKARVIDGKFSIYESMDIISKMDLLIGMRLHSIIFAAKMKVPVVGLIYDPKVENFLGRIGQKLYACDIANLNLEDLMAKIDAVWKNRESIKGIINKNIIILENEAKKQLNLLADILDQSKV